jgi:hypothetical protein
VQKRDKDTLLPLIKKLIFPGTKIITDEWKAYSNLEQEGYIHGVVNHSVEFINNDHPEINTQKIKRFWKSLKNELQREGRAGDNDDMNIFQFIYFHQQKNRSNNTMADILTLSPRYCYCVPRIWEGRFKASCLHF